MAKQWKIGTATVYETDQPCGGWIATDSNYDGLQDGNNEMGHGNNYFEAYLDLQEKLGFVLWPVEVK